MARTIAQASESRTDSGRSTVSPRKNASWQARAQVLESAPLAKIGYSVRNLNRTNVDDITPGFKSVREPGLNLIDATQLDLTARAEAAS